MRVFRIRAIHFFTFTAGMGFIVLLFLLPEAAKNGAWQGLLACAEVVVPSLFPFMTVSLFLTKTGLPKWVSRPLDLLCRGLFLDRHGVDILLSFTAGFPVGGLLIAEEYKAGLLNERRAAARMTYCVNSGPAFIITAVGLGMLGSAEIGLLLFLAVTAAALANGIVFSRLLLSREETPPPPPRQSEGFSFRLCRIGFRRRDPDARHQRLCGVFFNPGFPARLSAAVKEALPHPGAGSGGHGRRAGQPPRGSADDRRRAGLRRPLGHLSGTLPRPDGPVFQRDIPPFPTDARRAVRPVCAAAAASFPFGEGGAALHRAAERSGRPLSPARAGDGLYVRDPHRLRERGGLSPSGKPQKK